jgi:prophage DNA circulation protein
MNWRQNLYWKTGQVEKASFRGAAFYVGDVETLVGRRTEIHYSPDKVTVKKKTKIGVGEVWTQDLGPDADEFQVNGYVIQNAENDFNHFKERDALISALKTAGPGILIHPFYGIFAVTLKERATVTESLSQNLGMTTFAMTFVQYKKPIFKQQEPDYKTKIDTSALEAINAALDGFTARMRIYGAFLNTMTAPITQTMNKMQSAINSVKGAVASTVATALGIVSTSISLVNTLLNAPCDLANQIMDAGKAILSLVGMAGTVVQGGIIGACSGESRGDTTTMDGTTVKEDIGISVCEQLSIFSNYTVDDLNISIPAEQEDNLSLVISMAQFSMVSTACQIAIRIDFSNQDDMEYILGLIVSSFENLINRLGSVSDSIDDPLLFQKISQLRSDFVDSMYKKNTGLTKQIDYKVPSAVQSSLTLAYDRYDDIERESEVFDRNKVLIRHPGFLPSGETLRILDE